MREILARSGGRISRGEQQMLAIARALMGNPRMILMDEPSEGLAPRIVDEVARMLAGLKADGVTCLIAEQNLRLAGQVADRVYVIETGHIRWQGTIAELNADAETQRRYLMA